MKNVILNPCINFVWYIAEFHGLEASAGVVQAVGDVVSGLQCLVKVAGIKEDDLVTLSLISDLSYAWSLVDEYTPIMQVGECGSTISETIMMFC